MSAGIIRAFPETPGRSLAMLYFTNSIGAVFGGTACQSSLDGTYIFSADGASRSLFFKLAPGVVVAGAL